MNHKQGSHLKRSTGSMTNWQANTSYRILVKWYSDRKILMDMLVRKLKALRVFTEEME